jgi:hypothetical protein
MQHFWYKMLDISFNVGYCFFFSDSKNWLAPSFWSQFPLVSNSFEVNFFWSQNFWSQKSLALGSLLTKKNNKCG